MAQAWHPCQNPEKSPYHMLEEEVVSVGGLTVDILKHKQEKGEKTLLCLGFPDGEGGKVYEVMGERKATLIANNAGNLISALKMLRNKAEEGRRAANQGVISGAATLRSAGLKPAAIAAALAAQHNLTPEAVTAILADAEKETAKA